MSITPRLHGNVFETVKTTSVTPQERVKTISVFTETHENTRIYLETKTFPKVEANENATFPYQCKHLKTHPKSFWVSANT
jgi:hypothetical protein